MRINSYEYTNASVELTKKFNEQIKEHAKKARISKSEYIRRAIEEKIKREEA